MDKLNNKDKIIDYGIILLLILLSGYIVFNNLGSSTLFDWDESRNAQNALEILESNDWIVLKYAGKPDLWNTKPPLGAWLIALSFKIFGINEFALRFWSAFSAVGVIIIVYLFGKEIKNRFVGIIAAILLLINKGFIGYHGARTGDYDVLVTLFIISSMYLFYLYVEKKEGRLLIYTSIPIALAVLVKGVIGMFPLAIIFVYMCYSKSFKQYFNKNSLYALLVFLSITLPWFVIRFFRGSEFFIRMISYDLIKRSVEPIEGHVGGWLYYFSYLKYNLGIFLFILFLIGFIYSVYLMKKKNRSISILVIWISLFLLVFTIAQSKLFWYIIPIYPAISIIIAYFLDDLRRLFKIKELTLLIIFLIVISIPFISIIKLTEVTNVNQVHNSIKLLKKDLKEIDSLYIYSSENRQSTFFYLSLYSKGKVRTFENINQISNEKGIYYVITFDNNRYNILKERKDYKLVKAQNIITALFVKAEK